MSLLIFLSVFSKVPAHAQVTASSDASVPAAQVKKTKKKLRSVSHFTFEARLSSDAKQGSIVDSLGNRSAVFYRGVGFYACAKFSYLFTSDAGLFDFFRLCGGYSLGQLNSAPSTSAVNYFEQNVNSFPLSFEPGVEVPLNSNVYFFLNGSIRTIIMHTATSSDYTLSGLNTIHAGVQGGFDARLFGWTFINFGFGSFFKNGISFFMGFSTRL